eukprot:355127-Chlamydomonas_euryale.AAC.22
MPKDLKAGWWGRLHTHDERKPHLLAAAFLCQHKVAEAERAALWTRRRYRCMCFHVDALSGAAACAAAAAMQGQGRSPIPHTPPVPMCEHAHATQDV